MIASISNPLLRRAAVALVVFGGLTACQKNDATAGQVAGKLNDVAQVASQKLDQAASYVGQQVDATKSAAPQNLDSASSADHQYRSVRACVERAGQSAERGQRAARQGRIAYGAGDSKPRAASLQTSADMVGAEFGVVGQCVGFVVRRIQRHAEADGQMTDAAFHRGVTRLTAWMNVIMIVTYIRRRAGSL